MSVEASSMRRTIIASKVKPATKKATCSTCSCRSRKAVTRCQRDCGPARGAAGASSFTAPGKVSARNHGLQFTALFELPDDVRAAHETPPDEDLRDGGPAREFLDA